MKSYKEYMEIIKEKEADKAKEAYAKYGGDLSVKRVNLESRFTFDYSVEIMGMMIRTNIANMLVKLAHKIRPKEVNEFMKSVERSFYGDGTGAL